MNDAPRILAFDGSPRAGSDNEKILAIAADTFDSEGNVVDPAPRMALTELGASLAHATRALKRDRP